MTYKIFFSILICEIIVHLAAAFPALVIGLSIWMAMGYVGFYLDKTYGAWVKGEFSHFLILFGPISFIAAISVYPSEFEVEFKEFIKSLRK